MLRLTDAEKYYNGEKIFSHLNLTVGNGEFHILLGPSGCGKSTLFDGLTGVAPFDSGVLSWNDETCSDLRLKAGYMQQKDLLLPWLSLLNNALLPSKADGSSPAEAGKKAESLFSRFGLSGYASHFPGQVSGGMRQRCALVRTLMFNRDLILLDEPLSALDAITRRKLQSLLLMLQTEFNKTILMITHDIEEAVLLADTIYLLSPMPMKIIKQYTLYQPKPRQPDSRDLAEIKSDVMKRLEGDPLAEKA